MLWIGFHQFWRAHHDVQPPEPILQDTGTLECRDAVLAWDEIRHDPTRDGPDPTPRIKDPVTGKLVPDPKAKIEYQEHLTPRPAEWPRADFIVGNPPYVGNKRMRDALGDGYVDALRSAYLDVPDSVDYVMYWWWRAALAVVENRSVRAGLITTNSITQIYQRAVLANAQDHGVRVAWAIPDHPWTDEEEGAAVRVAMTVLSFEPKSARLLHVDDSGLVTSERFVARLNLDLTAHADVASASEVSLLATEGLAARGMTIVGGGFILSSDEASELKRADDRNQWVVKPYCNGRDLAARSRDSFVIDFGLMSEAEAKRFPVAFDIVRSRVKPGRDANKREGRRRSWWRFGEPNPKLREAVEGLGRYIATPFVSKHRFFTFVEATTIPDDKVVAIGLTSDFALGVLSSAVHRAWALAAGGKHGVGNDPSYNNSRTFDPFPFPDPAPGLRDQIGQVAKMLDAHRKAALERSERVTMTGVYNVVEKLRSGEALTDKEREVHELAACGVLKDLHDELDVLVAKAYGWEWPLEREVILERLVALHDERVREEKSGKVRWLRPDYQIPRFGKDLPAEAPALGLVETAVKVKPAKRPPWPADVISQIGAIKQLLAEEALSTTELAARFTGAKAEIIKRHLEILQVMGEVQQNPDERFQAVLTGVGR